MNDLKIKHYGKNYFAYEFPMVSVTASVIIAYFDPYRDEYQFSLILRKEDPEKGKMAFPGGFLNSGKENLLECLAREMKEETGIEIDDKDKIYQIDVRSNPDRDPRCHVIDVGFLVVVKNLKKIKQAQAGDDASKLFWVNAEYLSMIKLAFDHDLFFIHAMDFIEDAVKGKKQGILQ